MIGGIKYRFQCNVSKSIAHGQLFSVSAIRRIMLWQGEGG